MPKQSLSFFCNITMGQSPASSSYNKEKKGLPFFQGNADFGDIRPVAKVWCTEPKKTANKGDILISVRAPIGAINVATEKCCIGRGLAALTPKKCNMDYIFWALRANVNHIISQGTGSTFKDIGRSVLENIKLPEYSDEKQKQIANKLQSVDKLISSANLQIAKLDELVNAKFVEMFGDPTLNTKKLGVVKLKDIANYYNGLTYKPENVSDDGTIVLRSGNIQNGHLDFNDIVRVNSKVKEKYFVQNNDILMCSRNGSARLVGKVALIENLPEKMSFGAFMMIIRSGYYPYLLTYFQLEDFRRQIRTGATTTVNQITVNMLDKICLPLPEKTQIKKYAEYVIQIKAIQNNISVKLKKLETLKQSLMQEYFG